MHASKAHGVQYPWEHVSRNYLNLFWKKKKICGFKSPSWSKITKSATTLAITDRFLFLHVECVWKEAVTHNLFLFEIKFEIIFLLIIIFSRDLTRANFQVRRFSEYFSTRLDAGSFSSPSPKIGVHLFFEIRTFDAADKGFARAHSWRLRNLNW